MTMKYPVGVETFEKMIKGGFAYVDKTEIIYQLTKDGQYFFLSRPRRFGKSLMLSTIEAYFEGRRDLFANLWLGQAEGVDWTPHAVLRLNFVDTESTVEGLHSVLEFHLSKWERLYNISSVGLGYGHRFRQVIEAAHAATGQGVVILVDEYDKVLVNTMDDPELHAQMKQILKPVFGVMKGADRYIRFGMLTGVSRFSKLSIFSDLNNISDITLDNRYCTICGITEDELRHGLRQAVQDFADVRGICFDEMIQILKYNYDGYHFTKACPDIYNPYSLLSAFEAKELLHRWFESGTPTFLLDSIMQSDEDLHQVLAPVSSGQSLATLAITDNDLTTQLFQTGYLTIKGYDAEDDMYQLGIPNREVEVGLYHCLLPLYTGKQRSVNDALIYRLRKAVRAGEPEKFLATLKSFLAGIPQHLSEGKHEIYYENNLFLILRLTGFEVSTEVETSWGRIDAVLKTQKYIYVLELKLNGTAEQAMEQIRSKEYTLAYEHDGRRIIRLGVSFSKQTRTIDDWIIE